MQLISDELRRVMAERLKLGDQAKPVCQIEVDRMAFVPGRSQNLAFVSKEYTPQMEYLQQVIDETLDGSTSADTAAFTFPVKGKSYTDDIITSRFGNRLDPIKKVQKLHKGIDIGIPNGTELVATWSGVVKTVNMESKNLGYGYYLIIQHPDGVTTRYAHVNDITVYEGQKVNQGDVVAKSGSTGEVTGPHLHFEIMINGVPVDPQPYMNGKQHMYRGSVSTGGGVTTVQRFAGQIGESVFYEGFNSKDWASDQGITGTDTNLQDFATLDFTDTSLLKVAFGPSPRTTGFNFRLSIKKPGILQTRYAAEGSGAYKIYIGGQLQMKVNKFKGLSTFEVQSNIAFPAGDYDCRVEFTGNGDMPTTFLIDNMQVNLLEGRPDITGNIEAIDPTRAQSPIPQMDIGNLLYGGSQKVASLQVGDFVFMDTLVLDNVISVELDDQYEMDSTDARITLSNPNGYYSPDYNPYFFPEAYTGSPWSYFINGFHYGVLSENTPIRIFIGYGQNMMRVFTGLIDKVDLDNGKAEIMIAARNMYKKVLNKVLTEDKKYPKESGFAALASSGATSYDLTRRQEIIAKAKFSVTKFSAPLDYKFLLAIAMHETQFGTLGWGREDRDSCILGYDVTGSTPPRLEYRGIDNQLYYGAKRYFEAMKSRNWAINTLDDVTYFWRGGDKGAYQWAADTNWPNAVWSYYQQYKTAPPTDFEATPAWSSGGAPTISPAPAGGNPSQSAWLKSSIIADLIAHAGLTGWRRSATDIQYPDYIIEETYLIELNQNSGKIVKAVPGKEGEFIEEDYNAILTPAGWLNPFVDLERSWDALQHKVSDCIGEVIKDTNFRSYCDRYGTYRLEQLNFNKPVVATFSEHDNLVSLAKTIDFSRGRSHVVIEDDLASYSHFVDTELLMELKGELRTTHLVVPYARTYEAKRQIAERFFWDIKRLCRTLQVTVPGNPALDVLDRVYITDRTTTTRSVYTIKGIRTSFSVSDGYMQFIDFMWSGEGDML